MLLYNVTIKINTDAEEEWLHWMKNKHIPDIMNTGQFTDSRISKLLDQPEDDDPTYVIQYQCENREKYNHYVSHFAPLFREEYDRKYKGRYVAFRTLMEVL